MQRAALPGLILGSSLFLLAACGDKKSETGPPVVRNALGDDCSASDACIVGATCFYGTCAVLPCSGAVLNQSDGTFWMLRNIYDYDEEGREVAMQVADFESGRWKVSPSRATRFASGKKEVSRHFGEQTFSTQYKLDQRGREREARLGESRMTMSWDDSCAHPTKTELYTDDKLEATRLVECQASRPVKQTVDGEVTKEWSYDSKGRLLMDETLEGGKIKRRTGFRWRDGVPGMVGYTLDRDGDGVLEESEELDYGCVSLSADKVTRTKVDVDSLPPLTPGVVARSMAGRWKEDPTGAIVTVDFAGGRIVIEEIRSGAVASFNTQIVAESPSSVKALVVGEEEGEYSGFTASSFPPRLVLSAHTRVHEGMSRSFNLLRIAPDPEPLPEP